MSLTDTNVSDSPKGNWLRVELGNPRPTEVVTDPVRGTQSSRALPGPAVSYINIPVGQDRHGTELYSMPDEHDDSLFPDELAQTLSSLTDSEKKNVRRTLVRAHLLDPSGVTGLHNHAAMVAVMHPANGFWQAVSTPGTNPSWVHCPDHPELERMLAEHYDCPAGRPDDLEDTHYTQYGTNVYPPGAIPDPLEGITALHTSYGRDYQALNMGGWGYLGTVGTATASTATSLTGSAETGVSHAANDCAGQIINVGPNSAGTGSKVYGLIMSNTSGTTPVYTVDQWYNPASPGGAAGTTPNATGFYQITNGGASAAFVALTTDTTTPSLGGTAGTQDASAISTALTSEIATAGGGLIRKIAPIGHTAGAATWTATPVFTANGSDSLPAVVAKAALSPSAVSKALLYMTLVSPTATMSASGDQLTLTWTFTMT